MAKTEQDHVKPATSGQLVGKGPMTDEAKAAFLQQARTDEKAYTANMAAKDPQHYMYNPIPVIGAGDYSYADHPLNQKIAAQTRYVGDLKHQLHNGQSFSELADLRELAKNTTSLMNDQATLNGYYGVAEKHAAAKTSVETTQVNAAATSVAAPAIKSPVTELPRGAAVNLPPDMLDMMDPHELKAYHASLDHHVDQLTQKHGAKAIAALGLMAAAETVYATPGSIPTKLNAAGAVLKEQVVDAIPGVTYTQKMAAGKYQEARLDAAGYLPLGDATGITRSPAAQAIIDALPKDRPELDKMQHDKTQAPINRHLAEYQLAFVEAKEKGDIFKGLNASSHLTDLAEQKIVLEAQWKKSAEHFKSAIQDPNANWGQLAKSSDIGPQAAIHLAAVNSGYPAAFVDKMDATLTKSLALGTPVSPEMMAITKVVQVSVTKPQADMQTATNQEVVMAH
jgi:hypothetical protein